MGSVALELASAVRDVILIICAASVTTNIGLTAFYMFKKSVNEASV